MAESTEHRPSLICAGTLPDHVSCLHQIGERLGLDVRCLSECQELFEMQRVLGVPRPSCLVTPWPLDHKWEPCVLDFLNQTNCRVPVIFLISQFDGSEITEAYDQGAWSVAITPTQQRRLERQVGSAIDLDQTQLKLESKYLANLSILDSLTHRQRDVLSQVVRNAPTKSIARQLSVSKRLVELERSRLLAAFAVTDTPELMAIMGEHAILTEIFGRSEHLPRHLLRRSVSSLTTARDEEHVNKGRTPNFTI